MKIFKIVAISLSIIATSNSVSAQEEDTAAFDYEYVEKNYISSEEDAYFKTTEYGSLNIPSDRELLSFKAKGIKIRKIDRFTAFDNLQYNTPYNDSLNSLLRSDPSAYMNFTIPLVGGVSKSSILKYEVKGKVHVFVYENNKYQKGLIIGQRGIWIARSLDDGITWNYYFTGLTQQQPVYVKWYSKIPLIRSENKIEIEAAVFRQTQEIMHIREGNEFQLFRDGLIVSFDLPDLAADSDNDGLSDVLENRWMTNPKNKDTDGDGIIDSKDSNPRYNIARTEKTAIYEVLLNNPDKGYVSLNNTAPHIQIDENCTNVYMVITTNPDLLAVQPSSCRIIFMSLAEYKSHFIFNNPVASLNLGPLFKVDNKLNTYRANVGTENGGTDYIITKTEKGWKFIPYGMYMF